MASGMTMEVTGLAKMTRRLQGLQGPALRNKCRDYVQKESRAILVPAVKAVIPRGKDSPWTRYPTGKPKSSGPMWKKVTTRTIRTRSGELVAVSTKPRTYYTHMVIGGTKPHEIVAGGLFKGAHIHHPGARANDFMQRAAQGKSEVIRTGLGKYLMRS